VDLAPVVPTDKREQSCKSGTYIISASCRGTKHGKINFAYCTCVDLIISPFGILDL
jgi:hypothetical protein